MSNSEKLTEKDIDLYIEHVPGLVAIDTDGIVVFVNEQCCQYFKKPKNEILGKHILQTFPESKMIDALNIDEPEIAFYRSHLGIGISIQVPLFKDNVKCGLLEFDVIQKSRFLYEFSDAYSRFLDEELKSAKAQVNTIGEGKYSIDNIAGSSLKTLALKEEIIMAAKSNSIVLITGETGTGKELVAHAIHNLSSRRKNKIIKVNSSALPENLVESELFGYEKGSFTGASKEGKKGKFELADKGTLFIDEINQMPLKAQPKILRALQEKEVDHIGGDTAIPIDVRVIAASNENLKDMVNEGRFRKDLYYRLNVIEIKLPPLRERKEDIEEIAEDVIKELNMSMGLSVLGIEDSALELLKKYEWPGNIRELHNVIERAMNNIDSDYLTVSNFNFFNEEDSYFDLRLPKQGASLLDEVRDKAEKDLIIAALHKYNNNKTRTAEYLDIARPVLYKKMKRLGITNK